MKNQSPMSSKRSTTPYT